MVVKYMHHGDDLVEHRNREASFGAQCTNHSANSMCPTPHIERNCVFKSLGRPPKEISRYVPSNNAAIRIRKVSNRVEKARNCPNACRYQRVPFEAFWGEGQQSSPGTGGGAWTKITNAKRGVIEKVQEDLV